MGSHEKHHLGALQHLNRKPKGFKYSLQSQDVCMQDEIVT